jgi:hypothetical protein
LEPEVKREKYLDAVAELKPRVKEIPFDNGEVGCKTFTQNSGREWKPSYTQAPSKQGRTINYVLVGEHSPKSVEGKYYFEISSRRPRVEDDQWLLEIKIIPPYPEDNPDRETKTQIDQAEVLTEQKTVDSGALEQLLGKWGTKDQKKKKR